MRSLWLLKGRVIVDEAGRPIICDECPCGGCKPKTLHEFRVDGRTEEERTKDLSAWTGEKVGYPGGVWRLLETTDCYVYASGIIDEDGRLVGLPATFESQYHYLGWMVLQQGCVDEFGATHWPPSICDEVFESKGM